MSVAYRSWEVANGPVVGFNIAMQGNMCATAGTLVAETPNYGSNTILCHESFMKGAAAGVEVSNGVTFPSNKTYAAQDTVIQGLSSLSLYPQPQLQALSPSEECRLSPSCESRSKLNCSDFFCIAESSTGHQMEGEVARVTKSVHHDDTGSKGFQGVPCSDSALQPLSGSSDVQGSISPNTFWVATRNYFPFHENYEDLEFYHFPKHTLDVVVEDKPLEETFTVTGSDLELDALSASSTSSVSSLLDSPVNGSVPSDEKLHGIDECEVQSALKGSSTFTGGCSPPRKGLSRFYAGKSRSFSCLGDAMSVKDLAKPENPYAKKRRCHVGRSSNAGRPQLPPLQKGPASISKKAFHNGKSSLALAVSMSTREDSLDTKDDDESFLGAQRSWHKNPLASRSYSLSDLQRVTERQVSSS